jgi:hypothetical protein
MELSITTEVDAPPEVVFAVLSEVERWPEWTPTVTRVERLGDAGAPLALGGRLRIVQPKVPPAEWTITALEPGRGFRLVSRSPGATVEANHWAEPVGADRSRVTLSVTVTGFLGRVIGWMMRGLNQRYLSQEAAGLKRRSEERARGTQWGGVSGEAAGRPGADMSPHKPAVYRAVIDELVRVCREDQGRTGADRARSGVWNRNASTPAFNAEQYAFNQLLARMKREDREILALMLAHEVELGVFETLKVLEQYEIAPFEDGYEGSPYHDFIGRLTDWEWPES